MTQILPSDSPDQPAGNAVQLALKDELRALEFNLQKGAQWLLHDVGDRLLQRIPTQEGSVPARGLRKLQTLVDSSAQAALSTLRSARQAAASTVLDDAAYRQFTFTLAPLADLLPPPYDSSASRPFTSAVYWLTRHALELDPDTAGKQIAREQAIDEAYWRLTREHEDLIARVRSNPIEADTRDHSLLCAALLLTLLTVHPLRDANLPPWAERATPPADQRGMLRLLLAVVVTMALAGSAGPTEAKSLAELLELSRLMVNARFGAFEAALAHPAAQRALADELAFLMRHA